GGAVTPEEADRPRVDTSRLGLKRVDDLHGPQLRRAGHRAARETSAHGVDHADVRAQLPADRGDQLMQRLVRFGDHEPRDVHAANFADPAQIVADQIDDHEVLRPGLAAAGELGPEPFVLGRRSAARGRALDRLALHRAGAVHTQESLRRRGRHGYPGDLEVRRVRRRIDPAQPAVEGEAILGRGYPQRIRQADLIALTLAQLALADRYVIEVLAAVPDQPARQLAAADAGLPVVPIAVVRAIWRQHRFRTPEPLPGSLVRGGSTVAQREKVGRP